MLLYILMILGISAVGLVFLWFTRSSTNANIKEFNAARTQSRRDNLSKIKELAQRQPSLTNDDVQSALNVSHATAARYLSQLVESGAIVKQGKTGRGVRYVKR